MKRFIEIAIALAVIVGAATAHAQTLPGASLPGGGTAELAPSVNPAPVHRTMAAPKFAIPVVTPATVRAAAPLVANARPVQPTPAQPTAIGSAVRDVAAPQMAPSAVAMTAPDQSLTMAPNVSPLPLPPTPAPVLRAPTPLPGGTVAIPAATSIPASTMAAATSAAAPMSPTPMSSAPMPTVITPPGSYYSAAPVPLPMPQAQPAGMTPITLEAGTGQLLRLPVAAATIMSAQPTIARVQPASPTSLFVMGVGPGRTTVIAARPDGTPIAEYDVMVTPGMQTGATLSTAAQQPKAATPTTVTPALASAAQAAINQSVPGAQGVLGRAGGHSLILTGTVATAQIAQSAVSIAQGYIGPAFKVNNQLTVLGSIQVNVRVRIAEIDRNITRQLGFNWQNFSTNAAYHKSGWLLGLAGGAVAALSSDTPYSIQGVATGAFSKSGYDVNGVIDALAQDNLVTILAEPNLTAQSGETASFLAGGEFPIPVAAQSSNGAPTVTIAFKQFGVSLALVPTVLSPNRLNLRIRPEVSQLSTQGEVSVPFGTGTLTIPALTVRRAETTIELGSGQSFAIAGLLQKTSTNATNALPGLGELPILGALFKSNAFQRGESELVIIVTPYIVRPVSDPTALRTPTDHFRPATDLGRILFGRQLATTPAGTSALDAGFILK